MTGIADIHPAIRAAIRAKILATSGIPASFHWEGTEYFPQPGTPFLVEVLVPVNSRVRALGRGGTIAHRVIANMTVKYPAKKGTLAVEAAAGALMQSFSPATSLVYDGASGVIQEVERSRLSQEPDWIACTVTATIMAYTTN